MPSSVSDPPPPRRKSCGECVKAKRRCDLRTPTCWRCVKKTLLCIYVAQPEQWRIPSVQTNTTTELSTGTIPGLSGSSMVDFSTPVAAGPVDDFVTEFGLNMYSDLVMEPPNKENNILERMYWRPELGSTQNLTSFQPSGAQHTSSSGTMYCREDYHKMNQICDDFSYEDLVDPSSRIHYNIAAVKSFHCSMARKNQTPFLHPRLYKHNLPISVANAFTSCVLYANKTPANEAVVFRVMDRNASDLLEAEAGQPRTPQENLARVQALLLHQTIRVFDGDIGQRAGAEAAMPILKAWTLHLSRLRDNLADVEDPNNRNIALCTPQSWEAWIFAESVRRTIIMSYYFMTLYTLLKSRDKSLGPWGEVHPWTMSRHLWEAPSSFDFFCMWREKPQYKISNVFFEDFLKEGKGNDVDEFGRILLVTYMGLDESRQWFKDTGSTF